VRVSVGADAEPGVRNAELTSAEDSALRVSHSAPKRFGDYELLEEIGRGGMGVVFRARQVSLNRLVAVKMIVSGELASPEFVQRFHLEAEAAAGLQHLNIVAIHEVGMHEGQHFYSMDYVEGQTLAERALNNPLPPRLAADYLKTIAEAVHYAHQRGILHRDLKPSNVLIDALDQPHLTDFGLAKRLTGDSELTLTGQVLGSPNYMPPEQALGQRQAATIACDVYSLGAILYFLLTGRPPFAAESMTQTLQQVVHIEPVSPQLLNPTVPRDLETICLKCLSKEPRRRYGSAQDLAGDLARFLSGEPVQARPVGAAGRAWRWCRRNPPVASLIAGVVMALAMGIAGVVLEWRRAELNAKAEARQRELAEANFQTARAVVDRMLTRVANDLADEPRMEQLRRKLLEDALSFYQGFLKQKASDSSLRHEAAQASARLGYIYYWLGQYEKSFTPLDKAQRMLTELSQLHPGEPVYLEEMARTFAPMAHGYFLLNRMPEALTCRRKQVALYGQLQRRYPTVTAYFALGAEARVDLGNTLGDSEPREALEEMRQALALYEKHCLVSTNDLGNPQPEDFTPHLDKRQLEAHIRHWLGARLKALCRIDEAKAEYRRCCELRMELAAERPKNVVIQNDLAHVRRYLADVLADTGKAVEAEQLLNEAIAVHQKVLNDHPGYADFARASGVTYRCLGRLLLAVNRTEEAGKALSHALETDSRLADELPGFSWAHQSLAADHFGLGLLWEATGRISQATASFRAATGVLEKLIFENPQAHQYQYDLAWGLVTCPLVELRDTDRALALARQTVERAPNLADNWRLMGVVQYRTGDLSGAIESLNKAAALLDGPDPKQWLFLAMACSRTGDQQQARRWYDKALAFIEKNHPLNEELDRFHKEAMETLGIASTRP
jgi:tetratricopeptide (TPR) repeat protein